jgi:hypothetical protein
VFKKIVAACAMVAGLFMACESQAQQAVYNSIATAYLTTTISQFVVFDSTMQQGGTFEFSVLAHNGGGRAGQSDTANVKIEFFTSGNALVTSANTSYSANLPNPNAACGNPCIDPSVPWTTLSVSSTLTAAQAATVAYAKVSMYGIDGSYWAGDYGPWYRAPTLTVNGTGNNRLYNPEFGPYNGVTAQGWTSSPGFGACQGAWGGSNACIVNSSGTPGTSTVGLVANQNGGGPSATGGTTSGQAGGYNSTMSTSNPNGAPAATTSTNPAGTTTTYTLGQPTDNAITNNGTIAVTGANSNGINSTNAASTTITNAGTITTDNGSGINAQQGSGTSSNITVTNSGSITANTSGNTLMGNGYSAHGIMISFNGTGSTGTATVNNTSAGTIAVTNGDGVVMMGYGTTVLNNDGSITSTPTGTNSMPAVLMGNNATINNTGSITGDVGVDFINTTAGSTINNSATGTITGNSGLAIINLGTSTGGIINNTGTITGDVQLSTNGVLNQLATGSVAGAVRTTDTSAVVNIGTNATTATTTLAGNLGDPANTSAPSGTYGNFPRAFTFQPLSAVNINTGSTLTDNTGHTINATSVTNNGGIVVGAGANLTANAAVTSNGDITTWFNGPSYGQFTINGALTLGSNATYTPVITGNTSTNVTLNSPYTSVISASGGITGAFVATSGQVAGVNWTIAPNATNANALDVTWTPSVYVTGTAPGNPIVTTTSTNGATVTTTTTANGTPTQTAVITAGTPVTTVSTGFARSGGSGDIQITRTINASTSTPVTTVITTDTPVITTVTNTTPVTTVTNTTPTTVTTYSDGSTTTANGQQVTTTATTNQVTTSSSTTHTITTATQSGTQVITAQPVVNTATASVAGMGDALKLSRNNPFVVDPLMPRDDNWVTPMARYSVVNGNGYAAGGVGFGRQFTKGDTTAGLAMNIGSSSSQSLTNADSTSNSYAGTVYAINRGSVVWVKGAIGFSHDEISASTKIPQFGLINSQKAKQDMAYADVGVYSAQTWQGLRPLVGVTVVHSSVNDYATSGSAILAPNAPKSNSTAVMPYVGARYDISKEVGIEARVTKSADFGAVASVRATVKKQIYKDVSLDFSIGADAGDHYTAGVATLGLTWNF